jgi:hypothetical protein
MPRRVGLAWWIAASVWATEPASAQRSSVAIVSSRANEKVTVEVDPRPAGEVELRISIVDPMGNRTHLPPKRATADPTTGAVVGPILSVEQKGYWVDIEVFDAATGRSLGGTGSWIV